MGKPSLGEIISTNRRKQGLTQKALADQLNVTDKAVSKWERNVARPDINTIPKLAEILDVPVADLLNLPNTTKEESHMNDQGVTQNVLDAVEMTEEEYLYYENRRLDHLRLLIVQGIGAALGLLAVVTSDYELRKMLAGFLVMPLACAGLLRFFVRTFQIVRMKLGHKIYDGAGNYYVVPRNGLGVIGCFVIFGLFTCILTGVAHVEYAAEIIMLMMGLIEVFLLYTDIKIVRTAGRGRASLNVIIAFAATIFVLSVIVAVMWFTAEDDATLSADETQSPVLTEYQMVNPSHFTTASSMFKQVCRRAEKYVLAEETENRASNYEIVIPSSLKAAYFLTAKDAPNVHYDVGSGTYVNNAVVVIGHYNVNIANTSPRDEWVVCVFPDFVIDPNGGVSYDEANEYCDYLQAESLEVVYSWLCEEYYDMNIVQLDIPVD